MEVPLLAPVCCICCDCDTSLDDVDRLLFQSLGLMQWPFILLYDL